MNANRDNTKTTTKTTTDVRASDAERERIAKMVSDAAGEGRLTLDEAEERLEHIYATRFRHELDQYIADLPGGHPADRRGPGPIRGPGGGGPFPVRLRIHAAVAVLLSVLLIVRWATLDVPFFFPIFPMFFLFGSLVLHARVVGWSRAGGGPWRGPWGRQQYGPPWRTERPTAPAE
ncbi:MAG TPA: DUF1707 domain-containing protein [Actinophytocola sp.]|jgi:hypothetical protein|uniref:DUF1707 SHOCT-like domain-containing protein n=1 Tax=Actinophytocola sp. TaxID=1872138 RepID=UPI002F91D0A6